MPVANGVNTYINDAGETKPINIYYTWSEPYPGTSNGETVVLVTGLGCQLIHSMYNTFVAPLCAVGYRVLRFDNRDSGKSSKLHDLSHGPFIWDRLRSRISDQNPKHQLNYPLHPKHPIQTTPHTLPDDFTQSDYTSDIVIGARPIDFMDRTNTTPHKAQFPFFEATRFWSKIGMGKKLPQYEISDLALDVVLLLNHLGVDKFHVHGVSMGGMISQYIAALIPSRILSLALVMTTTGNTSHNATMKFLLGTLIMRRAPKPDAPINEIIAFAKETQQLIGVNYPDIPRTYNNDQEWDSTVSGMVRRAPRDEPATLRQMSAIDGQESRDYLLDFLAARLPIFIFHGRQDQLVPFSNAGHMTGIAKQSLLRQINPPRTRHPDDTAPLPASHPVDIITTTDGRRDVTTVIGRQYQNRRPFTMTTIVDKVAHDITDDVASFLTPHHMAFMDCAMGRANIMQPIVLPIPQFGTEPDICFGVPLPDEELLSEQQFAEDQLGFDHITSPPQEVANSVAHSQDIVVVQQEQAEQKQEEQKQTEQKQTEQKEELEQKEDQKQEQKDQQQEQEDQKQEQQPPSYEDTTLASPEQPSIAK